MTTFTPTPEQVAITDFAANSTDNLCVIARAGAAKTSTLILIAKALPQTRILSLAFNKKIATEMTERLPSNCEAKTLHGLGYGAWAGFIGRKMKISDKKVYYLLRAAIDALEPTEKSEAYESMADILKMVSAGKASGYLPDSFKGHWKPLIGTGDFFASLPTEPSFLEQALVERVSEESFRMALTGELDFDDMIFCPAICQVSWPSFPLTMIDEAQDLSPIDHHILKKMVKSRRIIAVGDPLQAIYGFRGALSDSLHQLQARFAMQTLPLTISFRCARAITKNVHYIAPDMQYPEWAAEGEVRRPKTWGPADLALGDAIICRNNAPLFSMAIRMIEADLLPEIAGKDLAGPILKIMKKLGKDQMPKLAALDALSAWKQTALRKARDGAKGQVHDYAECIRIMLDRTKTLGDASAYLTHLVNRDGRIYLMTGHKAKGLEFDRVFFLDQHMCRKDQEQDANIKYVIETRPKSLLTYVTSDTFVEVEAAE
jgi:superfamily I DNA/RNA helicase